MDKRFEAIWTRDEEKELAKLAKAWKKLDTQVKDLTAQRDALKAQMTAALESKGQTEAPAGMFRISWTQTVSRIFDQKTFKAENARLFTMYQTDSVRNNFSVK